MQCYILKFVLCIYQEFSDAVLKDTIRVDIYKIYLESSKYIYKIYLEGIKYAYKMYLESTKYIYKIYLESIFARLVTF